MTTTAQHCSIEDVMLLTALSDEPLTRAELGDLVGADAAVRLSGLVTRAYVVSDGAAEPTYSLAAPLDWLQVWDEGGTQP